MPAMCSPLTVVLTSLFQLFICLCLKLQEKKKANMPIVALRYSSTGTEQGHSRKLVNIRWILFCLLSLKWESLEGQEPALFIFVPPTHSTLPLATNSTWQWRSSWQRDPNLAGLEGRPLHKDDKSSQLLDHLVSPWTWESQFLDATVIIHPRFWAGAGPRFSISSPSRTDKTWAWV